MRSSADACWTLSMPNSGHVLPRKGGMKFSAGSGRTVTCRSRGGRGKGRPYGEGWGLVVSVGPGAGFPHRVVVGAAVLVLGLTPVERLLTQPAPATIERAPGPACSSSNHRCAELFAQPERP